MLKEKILIKFGSRLKSLRSERGMSQETLADSCELDRTYISGLERGVRNPSLICIVRVAMGLNIGAEELIKGIDSDYEN